MYSYTRKHTRIYKDAHHYSTIAFTLQLYMQCIPYNIGLSSVTNYKKIQQWGNGKEIVRPVYKRELSSVLV